MVKATIAQLFGKSPISPLQEHMQTVLLTVRELTHFVEVSYSADWIKAESIYQAIRNFENQADDEKREIRLHLPRSLFMPIARNDLLTMVSLQDKVANTAKDIAGVMLGRQLVFPAAIQALFLELVSSATKVSESALLVILELENLLEAGFSGIELATIEKLIDDLDALEKRSDELEIEIRNALMQIETDLPPIDVIFMYRVIELVGALADKAQKVGDHVHIIVAR